MSEPALVLEPQVAAHAEEMFPLLSDPALYEIEGEPPRDLEWLRARFTRLETRQSADGAEQWLNWVVRWGEAVIGERLRPDVLRAIGYVQATVYADATAEIAYVVGSPWWGRGLATRAVEAMVQELAATYGAQHLRAVLKRANTRSRRLLDRLGFTLVESGADAHGAVEADEWLMVRRAVLEN